MNKKMSYPDVLKGIQEGLIARATRMEGSRLRELRAEKVQGVWFPREYTNGELSKRHLNVWEFSAMWDVIGHPDEPVIPYGFTMTKDEEESHTWNLPQPFQNKKVSELIEANPFEIVLRIYRVIDGRIELEWTHTSMVDTGGEANE